MQSCNSRETFEKPVATTEFEMAAITFWNATLALRKASLAQCETSNRLHSVRAAGFSLMFQSHRAQARRRHGPAEAQRHREEAEQAAKQSREGRPNVGANSQR